ncbi:MAG TPA: hypothetical protein VIG24_18965 [Acidimicrobiia bacterium]
MTEVEVLIEELERAHKFRTYGGAGYTIQGRAAGQLRALLMEIDALKVKVAELLIVKHELNERLLEARAELNLKEALLRERS